MPEESSAASSGGGAPSLSSWLASLAAAHDVRCAAVEFRDTPTRGRALFASRAVAKGEVVLSVPRALTLCVQDGAGLALPSDGSWPRTRAGVAANAPAEAKTWEFVLARALLDAIAGDGGRFWSHYGGLMPPPESLAHPFLLPPARLRELMDAQLERSASSERERIAALMPDLLDPVGEDDENDDDDASGGSGSSSRVPAGAWALALVRSRAMLAGKVKGGGDAHVIVPFLDLANHDPRPNVDYRCEGVETPERFGLGAQLRENADRFELVALRDVDAGEELRLSYAGGKLSSREHFEQFGFAPAGGAASDRLDLGLGVVTGEDAPSAIEGKTAAEARKRLAAATRAALEGDVVALGDAAESASEAPRTIAAGAFLRGLLDGGAGAEAMSAAEEAMTLRAIRTRVGDLEAAYADAGATLEEDAERLDALREDAEAGGGGPTAAARREREANALGYAIGKKRLVRRVAGLLSEIEGLATA